MDLKEYLASDDPNLWWTLSCGDHENLLDEALEKIEDLEEENQNMVAFISGLNVEKLMEENRHLKSCINLMETAWKSYLDSKELLKEKGGE